MALANTADSWGSVARVLHWLTALSVFTIIPVGLVAHRMPHDSADLLARKVLLFQIHKALGLAILLLAVVRIHWALTQPRPGPAGAIRPIEHGLAQTVHWLLYACLVLVPLTGWIHHAATEGFAPIPWPFGQGLPLVPQSGVIAGLFAGLHVVLERVLMIALALHIAGALKHHIVDRDGTLRRMVSGAPAAAAGTQRRGPGPFLAAVGLLAAAIAAGAGLGAFSRPDTAAQVAALAEVETDWRVEVGTLALTVQQFGSPVEGRFADWTAAIGFSEAPDAEGRHGHVEVTVAIGSLTLGSITAQALGPDYFDAARFPTALFEADILSAGAPGQYTAEGTLTLKGRTVAVTLPFALALDGDRATVTGGKALDRLDFGVGAAQTSAGTLGFAVPVSIALTAVRADG